MIPKFDITNFVINIDQSNFHVSVEADGIPSDVTNSIESLFNSQIVGAIQSAIQSAVNEQVTSQVNSMIQSDYPTSVELVSGISFSTGFTGPILVTSNYIQVNLDSSVFLTANGYQRTATAAKIPGTNPSGDNDITMFVG